MIKFYSLLSVSILLSSCIGLHQLDYLGNSYTPTQDVDVYVDPSAVKKPYTIMGKTYVEIVAFTTLEKVQKAAIKKAKEKGADAVLFRDYFIHNGSSFQTVTKSDSIGGSSVRVRTTTATPVETTRLDILFLKYD
jgi:hypothetical protein